MTRVTLRLPDDLHRRLQITAEWTGSSLNQLIISALSETLSRDAEPEGPEDTLLGQVRHLGRTLGDLTTEIDDREITSMQGQGDDAPDTNTLRESMPRLNSPLSATIRADRDERF